VAGRWYIHSVYQDGLTNYGRVIGNWFRRPTRTAGLIRRPQRDAKLGWEPPVRRIGSTALPYVETSSRLDPLPALP